MKINVIPKDKCPHCGAFLDRASGLDHDSAPTVGDITICMYCGEISVFQNNMLLRRITKEEYFALHKEEKIELTKVKKLIKERL